jgi:hypothetical protein
MPSNLDRYKSDLESLIAKGEELHLAMQAEALPEQFESVLKKRFGSTEGGKKKVQDVLKGLPSFILKYQSWYSEAKAVVRQLLPDRLSDFAGHYEKPRTRKNITADRYTIEDYLRGLAVTRGAYGTERAVGPEAAIPRFRQQLAILDSARARFHSSLFDIRQLVQGDLFDSELDTAEELAKNKFARAAGAVAGVVLERHLSEVCNNHLVKLAKSAPGISDLNDALKNANVIDVPQWRINFAFGAEIETGRVP